jgi:hypothetical protein
LLPNGWLVADPLVVFKRPCFQRKWFLSIPPVQEEWTRIARERPFACDTHAQRTSVRLLGREVVVGNFVPEQVITPNLVDDDHWHKRQRHAQHNLQGQGA